MTLHEIVWEQAILLSLSLNPNKQLRDTLVYARLERMAGYKGLSSDEVADKMEHRMANDRWPAVVSRRARNMLLTHVELAARVSISVAKKLHAEFKRVLKGVLQSPS